MADSDSIRSPSELEARHFEERIAHLSMDEAAEEDCEPTIQEAVGWLDEMPTDTVCTAPVPYIF